METIGTIIGILTGVILFITFGIMLIDTLKEAFEERKAAQHKERS